MRRRVLAVAAVIVAFTVVAPELAEPVGATTTRSAGRTEQTRPAARRTLTAAQKAQLQQYIKTHPQKLTTTKKKTPRRARVKKRRVSRKTRAARRKRAAKKRRAKAKAQARKRKARRGAVVAKQRRAKNNNKKKKGGSSTGKSLMDWAAIMFLIALPFIAVALLLFGTDYRRRPRAPSNKKRRGVLVVTPVGRKY